MQVIIDSVLIANENGLPLFSKQFTENYIDETLLLGFFQALKSFAASFMQEDDSEIKYIHIGDALLDFDKVVFDEIGTIDVLLITHEMDPSTSHSLVAEITEKFAIFLEEIALQNHDFREQISRGKFPDCSKFESNLSNIIQNVHTDDTIDIKLSVRLPSTIFPLISSMFKMKPEFATMYDNRAENFLEQALSDYALDGELEKTIRRSFKTIANTK